MTEILKVIIALFFVWGFNSMLQEGQQKRKYRNIGQFSQAYDSLIQQYRPVDGHPGRVKDQARVNLAEIECYE